MTNYTWRGEFTNNEINALHAQAFGTRIFTDDEWDWKALVDRHSLGWIVARDDDVLVGFVNVAWDGFVHAWVQDTMVSQTAGRRGIGTQLVATAREVAEDIGGKGSARRWDTARLWPRADVATSGSGR